MDKDKTQPDSAGAPNTSVASGISDTSGVSGTSDTSGTPNTSGTSDAYSSGHSRAEAVTREYALGAIEKAKAWKDGFGQPTSDRLRGFLAEKFQETCKRAGLTRDDCDQLWARTGKLATNPAMAEFLLDSRACESEFFVPWQNAVPRAVILEAAYAYGYDLKGKFRRIPEEDPFTIWVKEDAGFKFARWRNQYVADFLISNQCRQMLFLGAGWLPELRYTDYYEKGWTPDSHITCCDVDETIKPEIKSFLRPDIAANTSYSFEGLLSTLEEAKRNHRTFDGIVAKGVMSYCISSLEAVIQTTLDLLEPGKSFMFDLQTPHWSMMRNGYVFGWGAEDTEGSIFLMPTDEIVRVVNEACGKIQHSSVAYQEDPTDKEPVGVVVTITK